MTLCSSKIQIDIFKNKLISYKKRPLTAIKFQEIGLTADYVILLDAPNTVLTAREHGKRLDPETNECYHPLFNWTDDEVKNLTPTLSGIEFLNDTAFEQF